MEASYASTIGAALLMSLAIGIERQVGQHPAGLWINRIASRSEPGSGLQRTTH